MSNINTNSQSNATSSSTTATESYTTISSYVSPIQISSTIVESNAASSKTSTAISASTREREVSIFFSVLSSLIPESLFDLWSNSGKKDNAEESWVPADPNEIVKFPERKLPNYDRIFPTDNVESAFEVRRGPINGQNAIEQMKCERYGSSRDTLSAQDDVLCHLLFVFIDGTAHKNYLTMYRSENADDVLELCQRCRDCCILFRYIDKQKEDAVEFVHKLLDSFRQHMLWRSEHIAALIGLNNIFCDVDEKTRNRMLTTKCQPEGLYPLMIAIQNNQIDLISTLIGNGASLSLCDINGNNCVHFAAQSSQAILQLLWEKAHSSFERLMNVVNNDGYTPLLLAIKSGNARCVSTLLGYAPLIALLELKGAQLDLNARNNAGQTPLHVYVHKDDIQLVFAIAAYDVDLDLLDNEGHSALAIAVSRLNVEMVRGLLVLGANPNAGIGEKPRHIAARFSRSNREACEILRSLIMCGAKRCSLEMSGCTVACADYSTLLAVDGEKADSAERTHLTDMRRARSFDSPQEASPGPIVSRTKDSVDLKDKQSMNAYGFDLDPDINRNRRKQVYRRLPLLYSQNRSLQRVYSYLHNLNKKKEINRFMISTLALDGGGVRGLATIQLLLALQKRLEAPLFNYFDWVAGTSTGSLISAALASGYDLRQCLQLYLRVKDCVFSGSRPYDASVFEMLLKKTFGNDQTLGDLKYPKLIIPTVCVETFPVQLELMRNYELPLSEEENNDLGYACPSDMKIWRALRRSSAAPTYFPSSENKYVDGGIASNNPTLELLSEVHFWNSVLQYKKEGKKKLRLGCVLSVGSGVNPVKALDAQSLEFGGSLVSSVMAIKSLGIVIIDQATLAEGAPVVRARSWCHSIDVPYFRLNAPLSGDIPLDCTDDSSLCGMMWDCVEFAYKNRDRFDDIANLLKAIGETSKRAEIHQAVPIKRTYKTFTSASKED
ncbi:unnamed protein product [Anisakis simplex]|uniref:phospholipase A2 n=1 Tax=Anisakis simplex TaxID=6269 RepID=A0A0M3JW24_ANISI|nr:unnamed protein product [Anisakis simplex]